MPPEPVVTRWGKWIESTAYYSNPDTIQTLIEVMEAIRNAEAKKSKNTKKIDEIISLLNDEQVKSIYLFSRKK